MSFSSGHRNLSIIKMLLLAAIAAIAANFAIEAWLAFAKFLVVTVGGNPYGW